MADCNIDDLRKEIIAARRLAKRAANPQQSPNKTTTTTKFKGFDIPACWEESVKLIERLPNKEVVDNIGGELFSYTDDAYFQAALTIHEFAPKVMDPDFAAKVACLDEAIKLEPRCEDLYRERSILAHTGFLMSRGSPQYRYQFHEIEENFKKYVKLLTLKYQPEEEKRILNNSRFVSKPAAAPVDLSDEELKLFRYAFMALVRREAEFFSRVLTDSERKEALPSNWMVPSSSPVAAGGKGKEEQQEQQKMVQLFSPGFKLGGLLLLISGLKPSLFVMYPPIENFASRWEDKVFRPWMEEFKEVLEPLGLKGELIQLTDGNKSEVFIIHRRRNPGAPQAVDETLKKVHAISATNRSWISDRFDPPVPSGPVKVLITSWNRGSYCIDALCRKKSGSGGNSGSSSTPPAGEINHHHHDDRMWPLSLNEYSFQWRDTHNSSRSAGENSSTSDDDVVSVVQAAAAALNYMTAFAAAGIQVSITLKDDDSLHSTTTTSSSARSSSRQSISAELVALFFLTIVQGVVPQCDLYFRLGIFALSVVVGVESSSSGETLMKVSDVMSAMKGAAKLYSQFDFQEK